MVERLKEIIRYKTNGNKAQFAAIIGWSPQYLNRMINGSGSFGLNPVKAVLAAFPEINARWLLFGTGSMLDQLPSDNAKNRLFRLIELEKYIPVMNGEEIRLLESGKVDWDAGTIARWDAALLSPGMAVRNVLKAKKKQK